MLIHTMAAFAGPMVRIHLPPAASLVRNWLSETNPIDDPRGISPRQPQRHFRRPDYQELKQELGLGDDEGRGLARLSPPCHPLYCRLRLSDRRTRRHPLSTSFRHAALGICHSRRLPTKRRRQSDPSGTSPTQSPRCEDASSSLLPGPFRDARAAIRRSAARQEFPITDAVRLAHLGRNGRCH